MKTKLILFFIVCFLNPFSYVNAQWINSINLIPANPTENDTVKIYIDISFPSGPCNDKYVNSMINGNELSAYAIHCLGPLTFICNETDTIIFNPLPPGNYKFYFHVDAGFGQTPCTPGIVPGPTDSISFTVSPGVGVEDLFDDNKIKLYPNPANHKINLSLNNSQPSNTTYKIKITNLYGKLTWENYIYDLENINIPFLPDGMYMLQLLENNNIIINKKLIIHH